METIQNSIPFFEQEVKRQQHEIRTRLIDDITYDANCHLQTFHGFRVGSYVRFEPKLMQIFKENRSKFSDAFLEQYGSGIFQVSYFQGPVIFDLVEHQKLGLIMENGVHRQELMDFLSSNGQYRMHSHSDRHYYVSTDYRNLVQHSSFKSVLIPTPL